MVQMAAAFSAATSYVDPEILKAGKATIDKYVAAEPRLQPYRMRLDNVVRRAAHTLSDSEEKLLADALPMAGSAGNVYGILSNADFPYPTVTLSDGKAVRLDAAAMPRARAAQPRRSRKGDVSLLQGHRQLQRTFGTTMNAEAQKVLFYAKARRYRHGARQRARRDRTSRSRCTRASSRASTATCVVPPLSLDLASDDGRRASCTTTILYAPLVSTVKLEYTPEEAQKIVLEAVAPLGRDYVATIQRAFADRWIDLLPNDGKRSGAYSNDVFGVHPYMLINYNGSTTTSAPWRTSSATRCRAICRTRRSPYPTADYPIFVAEVASTFNEALLNDYLLKQIKDDDARLSILGGYLENIKGTVFRQTQFAEFELRLHQMAQNGQPITGDALAKLYLDITRRYYGHDKGVTVVDDYIAHEWSVIPHFYSDFYVFQYATSFTASEALAAKVKSGDAAATRRYLSFLSAGGSKYPIDLLKDAGVDMTTDEPLNLTIQSMNRVMDEMEKILASKGR
jgi:oligoendopeptidase F